MGLWKSTVEKEYEPYVMPQDCGNHICAKYLKVSGAGEKCLLCGGYQL